MEGRYLATSYSGQTRQRDEQDGGWVVCPCKVGINQHGSNTSARQEWAGGMSPLVSLTAFQNIWAWMELFVCNKSEVSGAETGKLLMQVLSDSSRYPVRNIALLMQHDIHLPEERYHVAIKSSPVSNASFSFQQSASCKRRSSRHVQQSWLQADVIAKSPITGQAWFLLSLSLSGLDKSLISAALLPSVISDKSTDPKDLTGGFAVFPETPGHKQQAHLLSCLESPEQLPHMGCKVGMQVGSCRAIEVPEDTWVMGNLWRSHGSSEERCTLIP